MKKTPLYNEHVESGGKIVDFAGWELPVMYTSIIEEHTATREKAGLFDVSHMGEIIIRGKGSAALMKRLIPTRMDKLEPGKSMYSCFCNEHGGVVDDIFVFMKSPEEYYLVVNAATCEKDLEWIKKNAHGDEEIIDVSDETAKIDLQGPRSMEILCKVFDSSLVKGNKRFQFFTSTFMDREVLISQTGYTGEMGYELFLESEYAVSLWRALLEKGAGEGIKPAGLGARDTLRLECAYSLYGHELAEDISPIEAGLSWLISSDQEYIAKETLVRQKSDGAPRGIVCFELEGRGVPREKCEIVAGDAVIGYSTSGGYSPTFKKGIGMALIKSGTVKTGDAISVIIRGKAVPARVVRRPFYTYNG